MIRWPGRNALEERISAVAHSAGIPVTVAVVPFSETETRVEIMRQNALRKTHAG